MRWLVKIEARSDPLLPFSFLFADHLHPSADRGLRSRKTRGTPLQSRTLSLGLRSRDIRQRPPREVLAIHRCRVTLLTEG